VPVDQDALMRRDYELAERIGTKRVWDSFIGKYPSGFYTDLAKAHRDKLAAEAALIEATNKAKAAEEEQERLAIEGAKAADQAKAAEQARAAEKARVAAEMTKKAEEARFAEAEREKAAARARAEGEAGLADKARRVEEEKAAQQRDAAEKKIALEDAKAVEVERTRIAAQAKIDEEARIAADKAKAAGDNKAQDDKPTGQLAALTPAGQSSETISKPSTAEIPRLLLTELHRVGCNTGAIDGNWNTAAQRSLGLFNKNAGTKLAVKAASLDALDVVRSKSARICPLICDHGYKADSDTCTKIVCKAGYEVGDGNTCERIDLKKRTKPEASRVESAAGASPSVVSGAKTGSYEECRQRSLRAGGSNNSMRCYGHTQ
jgi:chemotaxis protein histidine kinase CheA